MAKLDDAIDVRVVAHINGLAEANQALADVLDSLARLQQAINDISVEMEVD